MQSSGHFPISIVEEKLLAAFSIIYQLTPTHNDGPKRVMRNPAQMFSSISTHWTEAMVAKYFYNHKDIFLHFQKEYPNIH
jgi:hypothetical protein